MEHMIFPFNLKHLYIPIPLTLHERFVIRPPSISQYILFRNGHYDTPATQTRQIRSPVYKRVDQRVIQPVIRIRRTHKLPPLIHHSLPHRVGFLRPDRILPPKIRVD
ncbi:hypothetical protein HanRHA438_Chr02g0057771 [Helianthus annuus]|nr:hypothetical protein HanRHA438_Chr02g0057771 [Helianthus annuus]